MFAKYLYLEGELANWPDDAEKIGKNIGRIGDVWNALSKLDGDRFCLLIAAEGRPVPGSGLAYSGSALVVSGGANDQYLCEVYINGDEKRFMVRNPEIPESHDRILIKRGQEEHFPKHNIVGLDAVREAVKAFVKRGELSKNLTWE